MLTCGSTEFIIFTCGYYYDTDSGWYYLKSRYYDPSICRFINADADISTGQGFLGCNAFGYCGNNPAIHVDHDGKAFETAFDIVSLGFSAAEVAANPYNFWAWLSLAGDVIDVAVPFLGGVGEAFRVLGGTARVLSVSDNVTDTIITVDRVAGSYRDLRKAFRGTGFEIHHIIEKRFIDIIPSHPSVRNMISVALTPAEHQIYTNRWRTVMSYGGKWDYETLMKNAHKVYYDSPEMLELALKELRNMRR